MGNLLEVKGVSKIFRIGGMLRGKKLVAVDNVSFTITDDKPVLLNCYVYEPDIVVVFDETIIDKHVNVGEGCHDGTILVLNTESPDVVEKYRKAYGFRDIYWGDGTGAALRNIGLSIPNSAMLGALAKTGVVGIEAVEHAIMDSFGRVGEKNVKAARDTYEHTQKA